MSKYAVSTLSTLAIQLARKHDLFWWGFRSLPPAPWISVFLCNLITMAWWHRFHINVYQTSLRFNKVLEVKKKHKIDISGGGL